MPEREIRIYKYLFSDNTTLEIEADNRAQARTALNRYVYGNRARYAGIRLDGEYVINHLQDVSKKVVNGKTYIWIGFESSPVDGWMEYEYYKFLRKVKNIKGKTIKTQQTQ